VQDPSLLYELRSESELGSPILIEALGGFVDAGHGVQLSCNHLLETFASEVVAAFEVDELVDYRSRRPMLVFDTDHWDAYAEPSLALHSLRDADGTVFLLLAGPEPDLQWERFVAALAGLVDALGVRMTMGLHAVPWAAPHTRPLGISAHGHPLDLPVGPPVGIGRVQIPASAGQLLQYRLVEAGKDAIGLAAHVPHYLALAEYPDAAVTLLDGVERIADLSLGLDPLRTSAAAVRAEIDIQVRNDEETAAAIRSLEESYDELEQQGAGPAGETLPTGDQLGAAFERFLAERSRQDEDDARPS
jgi:PAC2 family